jgi:DNA-binding CsgD family transcriptional regulator
MLQDTHFNSSDPDEDSVSTQALLNIDPLRMVRQIALGLPTAVALFRREEGRLVRILANDCMHQWFAWLGAELEGQLVLAASGQLVDGCSASDLVVGSDHLRFVGFCPVTAAARRPLVTARWELTSRQAEVAELLADGHANKSIATILSISEATVELHVTRMLIKAGVENRASFVAAYWRCC